MYAVRGHALENARRYSYHHNITFLIDKPRPHESNKPGLKPKLYRQPFEGCSVCHYSKCYHFCVKIGLPLSVILAELSNNRLLSTSIVWAGILCRLCMCVCLSICLSVCLFVSIVQKYVSKKTHKPVILLLDCPLSGSTTLHNVHFTFYSCVQRRRILVQA